MPNSVASDLGYTVCLCPLYGTLGISGLMKHYFYSSAEFNFIVLFRTRVSRTQVFCSMSMTNVD